MLFDGDMCGDELSGGELSAPASVFRNRRLILPGVRPAPSVLYPLPLGVAETTSTSVTLLLCVVCKRSWGLSRVQRS